MDGGGKPGRGCLREFRLERGRRQRGRLRPRDRQRLLRRPRPQAEGATFLYLGSAAGLSSNPDWSAWGDQRFSGFGGAIGPAWTLAGDQGATDFGLVAGAGDMDGDGFDDVLIGAPGYTHGQRDEGRVFVFFGSATGLRPRTSWIVESDQNRARFGFALAGAGDVNGDGHADVIVGAYQFDGGQANEGWAFAYLGSPARRLR